MKNKTENQPADVPAQEPSGEQRQRATPPDSLSGTTDWDNWKPCRHVWEAAC